MSVRNYLIAGLSVVMLCSQANAAETPPVLDSKSCEKPAYPRASLVNEEKGLVVLAFHVSADGKVLETKVDKSSGFKNLDKAAASALGQCKFKPGTKDGKPDKMWTKVEYNWTLE